MCFSAGPELFTQTNFAASETLEAPPACPREDAIHLGQHDLPLPGFLGRNTLFTKTTIHFPSSSDMFLALVSCAYTVLSAMVFGLLQEATQQEGCLA